MNKMNKMDNMNHMNHMNLGWEGKRKQGSKQHIAGWLGWAGLGPEYYYLQSWQVGLGDDTTYSTLLTGRQIDRQIDRYEFDFIHRWDGMNAACIII